jgi:excisionase family DNA binding protein
MAKADNCLSIDDVAERLGVHRSSVYKHIAAGNLRARKLGRRTVVTEGDLANLLAALPVIQPREAA